MDFSVSALLAVFSEPAFYAESGFISAVNPAAEAIGLEVGCPLNLILHPVPACGADETVDCPTALRGASVVLRCCGLGGGFLMVRVPPEPAAPEYAAVPGMVGGIRESIQDLNTAVEGLADSINATQPVLTASTLARRSLYRLERVASRLDWFYRLSTGAVSCRPQTCCPAAIVRRLSEYADGLLHTRALRLDYDDGGARWNGCVDTELLELIFWEVLSCLTAQTESGDPQIRLRRLHRDQLQLTFAVPNHTGDLPDLLETLPRFDEKDPSTWRRRELGLGIASMAARLHGGSLLLSADRDGPVRVVVTLRMEAQPDETLHEPHSIVAGSLHPGMVLLSEQLPLEAYSIEDL